MGHEFMIRHWLSLWERINARGNPYIPFAEIYANYSKKGRVYHGWHHIERCVVALDAVPARYFRELDRMQKNPIPCDCLIEMIL